MTATRGQLTDDRKTVTEKDIQRIDKKYLL